MSEGLPGEFVDAFNAETGRLFAADVMWMAQRMDLPVSHPASEVRIVEGRYTRMLRAAAEEFFRDLEAQGL